MRFNCFLLAIFAFSLAQAEEPTQIAAQNTHMEELNVWGKAQDSASAGYTSPNSLLTQEDMQAINAATTEDLVKYEPSIVIRRRYIGDSNGTLGLRGSNMFATSRSMVFADGVPLHYLLQSRWNGAPRWTMVSASEIAQVEILYGPFSAEYSGNSMGGVVLIETAIPEKRELHIDLDYFNQSFSDYGFDDNVAGNKAFISVADKIGDTSLYLSYNRLRNSSQPQSYYYDNREPTDAAKPVQGAIAGKDIYGNEVLYFGDTGVEKVSADNIKFRLGHDFANWSGLLNIAFEDRNTSRNQANSYLTDSQGSPVWGGSVVQDDVGMNIRSSRLSARDLDRQSLSLGLRIRGNLSEAVSVEGNISDFRILKDITYVSAANPAASDFTGNGQATDFDDTGWQTFDVKLNAQFGGGVALVTGGRYESYRLNLSVFESDRWHSGENNGYHSRSGGEAEIGGLFSQLNWDINAQWRAAIGLRYEDWRSHSGYYSDNDESTPEFDLVDVPSTEHSKFSPKFSLAYQPNESWLFRYSYGQAYRFPIVEELFSQYQAYNSVSEANPVLKPEDGKHHNLMLERSIEGGYLRVNVFQESIRDVIESQSTILPGGGTVRTFSAIDQVDTSGVEFIVNQHGFMRDALDIRFNLSYLDSTIVDNSTAEGENPAATNEGNDYPRMPHWRSNVMATYHLGDDLSASANVQYASNSFGRPDNLDTEKNVMGAQDGYTRIGVRTAYAVTKSLKWALGVDNITNEIAYVAHPWPGRTVYMSLSYQR